MSELKKYPPKTADIQTEEEAKQNYKIVDEYSSDVIIKFDSNKKILSVNNEAEKVFGHKKSEIIEKDLSFLITNDLFRSEDNIFRRYLEKNNYKMDWHRVELNGRHKDGSDISLEMSVGGYIQDNKQYYLGVIKDTSTKTANLERILESENILQGTLDSLTAHIAVLDNKGIIKKVNKAWLEFAKANGFEGEYYGVGSNYLKVCGISDISAKDCDLLGTDAGIGIRDVIQGKIPLFEMEYPCHSPMEKRWFIMRVTPIKNLEKPGVVVAHENITKRKKAEQKTRISESKYKVLSEAIPAFMFVTDSRGLTTFANRSWYDYTGFSKEQTYGTGWLEAIHPEDISGIGEKWQKTVKEKSIFEAEYRLRKHTGDYRWYLVRVVPRKDSQENVLEFVGTATDIEDRKTIEEELRASETFNRVVLESSPDCVKLLDAKGRIAYMNENGMALLEIEEFEKIKNEKLTSILEEENHKIVEDAIAEALNGQTTRFQIKNPTNKGRNKWWDIIILPIGVKNSKDSSNRLLAVSRDITETKRINEALLKAEVEQRKQAEAANLAKDEFLSVLSHELRTPLNAMLGWVRMLKTGTLNRARTKQAVEVIERNIVLQNELIEDLLDVSRIISGKMLIEKEALNFAGIVSNALDITRPLAEKKTIKISFNNTIGSQQILGDETRLHQIIINLLNNAVKFTQNNGSINLDLSEDSGRLVLKITDNGIGISEEFLPNIFDRFSQADSTSKRNFSGLGLGLTLVSHLTKLHNGTVDVFSEGEGSGSTFTVKFPIYEQETELIDSIKEEEILRSNEKRSRMKNVKILAVDDDLDGLIPLKILLEQKYAEVQVAHSAKEALELLTKNTFDVLISDIGMPDTDGYELIKTLRESNKNKNIPAIALTAYASLTDKEKALTLGFQKHIAKPLDYDRLFEVLEHLLDEEQVN